jgi:hypothetical protein
MMKLKYVSAIIILFCLATSSAQAATGRTKKAKTVSAPKARVTARRAPAAVAPRRTASRRPASVGGPAVQESDKALKVNGQARSINMTLVLKNDKDEINFVKPRTSFQDKIGETKF